MTTDELHTLAHQIAYDCARSDIESFTDWKDGRIDAPVEATFLQPQHRWYDLATVIRDAFEREAVARAVAYLDGASLLRRKLDAPWLAQILPEPTARVMALEPIVEAATP